MINSSKGISSVFLSRLIGVKQSTAWKMGHALRLMMTRWAEQLPPLGGIIEVDEKFIGGKPRYHYGTGHKGGKATAKQSILVTVPKTRTGFSAARAIGQGRYHYACSGCCDVYQLGFNDR